MSGIRFILLGVLLFVVPLGLGYQMRSVIFQDSAISADSAGSTAESVGELAPTQSRSQTLERTLAAVVALQNRFYSNSARLAAHLLRVNEVKLEGVYRASVPHLLAAASLNQQPWIWNARPSDLKQKLLAQSWVEDVELKWSLYPLKLVVAVRESEPWIVVEFGTANRRASWLISESGEFLQPLSAIANSELVLESSELPRLVGVGESRDGVGFKRALKLLKLLRAAGGLPYDVDRYQLLDDGTLKVLPVLSLNNPVLLFRPESFSDAKRSLEQLRLALSDSQQRGESIAEADIRFEAQVVLRPKTLHDPVETTNSSRK